MGDGRRKRKRSFEYWISIGVIAAAMNGAYQSLLARWLGCLFPLHVSALIPFVLGLSIASAGGGALLARRLENRLEAVGIFAAAALVAATAGQLAIGHAVSWQLLAEGTVGAVLTSLPSFAAMGLLTAACFRGLAEARPARIPLLVALEGAAFVAAYTGATFAVGFLGIAGPLLATAVLGLAPIVKKSRGVVLVGLAAVAVLPVDAGDFLFGKVRPPLRLWDGFEMEEQLGGGWSPYARVDFVRCENGLVAGVYNGSQQWAVDPRGRRDMDVRRQLYRQLRGNVLLIGTGGGQGIRLLGPQVEDAVAVELDPLVVKLATSDLAEPLGNPYREAEVVAGDGRAFLERTERKFDTVIYEGADLNVAHRARELVGMESYLYTAEGIAIAFDRLEEDGALLFLLSGGRGFARRIVAACVADSHTIAFEGNARGMIPFRYQLVVASRSERTVRKWLRAVRFGRLDVERFAVGDLALEEVRVPTDDAPSVYDHPPFVLPALLATIAALIASLFIVILRSRPRRETTYFGLVGAGFVFAEVGALVVSRASLGGYFVTSASVFALIAVGYAGGAMLSDRLGRLAIAGVTAAAFLVGLATVEFFAAGSGALLAALALAVRTLPLGFAMGLYLPRGLVRARVDSVPRLVAADILGGALGTLGYYAVVLLLGTGAAWLGGAGIYLAALIAW
ncbi:MAG: hypothetical protein R6V85_19885 [Polyangia bacterium]